MTNTNITWHRAPWSRRDLVIKIEPRIAGATLVSAPLLMGLVAPLFIDEIQWQAVVTSLVGVLIIAGITYGQLKVG